MGVDKMKNEYFFDDVLVEYMSEEQLATMLAYVYKYFDVNENSNVQLNNCINLVNFIKRHNLVIGEIEAEKLLDRSEFIRNMFKVLDNANVLVRVSYYPELKELYDLYCLRNDVLVGRDADTGYLDQRYGSKKDIDLLKLYYDEIGRYKLLTAEEEKDLAIKMKNGDEEARLSLIKHNLRLVVSIAKRFRYADLLSDLIQFGNEGLIIACDKYDVDKGYRFTTYATHWIRQSVTRGIADHSRTIRIPVHVHECILKIKKVRAEYLSVYGEYPSNEKIAELTNFSIDSIKRALECMDLTISLSTVINEEDDITLAEVIEDEDSSLDNIDQANDKILLESLFSKANLSEREEYVIKARNGFYGKVYTLAEIGEKFDVTRERVRQIEIKAMGKLKNALERKYHIKPKDSQEFIEKNHYILGLSRTIY